MAQSVEGCSTDKGLDPGGLRTLLDMCRLDLGSLRRDVSFDGGPTDRGAARACEGELDQRLRQVVERLERTASTLNAVLDRVAARPSAPAAAEVLAREADHRIRNSLQTVIALLERQARHADGEVPAALRQAAARVEAVAQVHAVLHEAPVAHGIVPELDLGRYLGGLCTTLGRAMDLGGTGRSLHVEVEPLAVSPATAQQLGLIVTELATNALRHAFRPEQPGIVRVMGARQRDGAYWLCVADDGKGLPRGFDIRVRPSGLGLRLVNVLADQLRARLTVDGHAGTRFTLALPASITGFGGDASGQPA